MQNIVHIWTQGDPQMKKLFAIATVATVAALAAGGLMVNKNNPVVMKDGSIIAHSKTADGPIPACYPNACPPENK
jgi:hypothetical protein